MNIPELLQTVVSQNASDLHLVAGFPPAIRVDSVLFPIRSDAGKLSPEETETLIFSLLSPEQKELLINNKEIDFSFQYENGARFRVNAYSQKGTWAAALRFLPAKIRGIEELNLPGICHKFATLKQGFVLVAGPTGHGKSTSIAAMIDEINHFRQAKIITIEDPIEYVYTPVKALISQREMHLDTHSWNMALRSALREDPDVVLIGEMRDYETIASALTIAETGHLVFASLHTNDASQTIDRVVDVFPENQQDQVKLQLSNVLEGIVSQRLIPAIKGGRVPATEILLATSAVRSSIREGKSYAIPNIIQTSGEIGMAPLEKSLAEWVKKGIVSLEVATEYSLHPEELVRQTRSR